MVTENPKEVLVVIYCFEDSVDLAGLLERAKQAFVQYAVVVVLAVQGYEGWIFGVAIVVVYIGILVELKHIAENLEQSGFI